ncbi:MAG: Gfo/Idh/MocA family oxidoreductase [Anaerolineae bacterium]|nr:Gfo/Idh/MocA family oxidoreductase [Anaerolineae bacterium]
MRIGIMSLAHHHAESYITGLRSMPGVELIGIADDDKSRADQVARQFNALLFDSYDALLAAKPDGVIICSENLKHRPLVEMAASAGVNILCEKPLATTLADGQAIIAACQKAGVHLMTAFPMRFHAAAVQVKAALDSGDVGKVRCCNATNQGENPDYIRAWFSDKTLAGGGAVMDHTVHVVDMLRWYMGAEVTEIYAEIDNLFHKGTVDVDTAGLLMISFDNGVFTTLDCSWSRPSYYPTWGNVKIDLICERGVLHTDYFSQNLTVYSHANKRPIWLGWGSDADAAMIAEFIASIRENRTPSVTGEDGLKAVAVTLAAYESAQAHQPVKL